jgi:hypothetical protein
MAWEPDYVEVSDLAGYVRIDDNVDDAQLALAITAASRAVDRHCRRQFGQVAAPEARYYRPKYSTRYGAWILVTDDLMTTTGLVVTGTYTLYPRNAAAKARPWTSLHFDTEPDCELEVTARWGWTEVPDSVKQACLLQASRLFARRGAPFGIAGSPDAGSEMRLLAKVDPDVAVTLEPYRRKARPQ